MSKRISLFIKVVLFVFVIGFSTSIPSTLKAQDTGSPALRMLAIYTAGGGVGGIAIGFAYWALDPLAPNADLRGSALQSMGAGFIVGFVLGILQLNRQAVFPGEDEPEPDEFEGDELYGANQHQKDIAFQYTSKQQSRLNIPIFTYQFKF